MESQTLRSLAALVPAVLVLALVSAGSAFAADDPLLGQQWALNAHAIGAQEAWSRSEGAGVIVAVIDSGAQLDHPDLADNLWTNPGEVSNGLDDDGNGFVDDVHGANMLDDGANVADDEGHGTSVAGIIAARAGNGVGGSGLAPRARIMTVKVFDAAAAARASALARAIRYAVGEGARILNVSLNGEATTSELTDAVRFAGEQGATIVASAGNDGRDIEAQPSYPVSLPDPAILGVTATTKQGGLLQAANHGSRSVDLAAPGALILSTARGSRYDLTAGTSMAAPFVAGALALLSAARPDLSQPQLREALLASSARTSSLADRVSAGRLDVGAAMHRIVPGAWGTSGARAGMRMRAARRVRAGRRATVRWSPANASSVTRWSVSLDGRRVRTSSSRQARSAHARIARPGRHRWTVTGYDARARKVVSATRSFRALSRTR